ncbi:MAG: hypothetical protein NWR21_00205 [Verrucomicrobiales bacterium]|nr:hypothetical protein [Verrucomicrobiales bacterium]MDP4792448.1 hypothetical protein [Verrucomicrobiales bacterium]MDP4937711.1 hypothetical protein [Verrucomicrobiales bacterium]MDP5006349.1 hypothetical protein [Verrucomicrobiales bacterium]
MNEREFSVLRLRAFAVNTTDGVVIKEEALLEARCQGHFAGDGLNVGDRRPPRE